MQQSAHRLQAAGGKVVAITMGTPEQTAAFRRATDSQLLMLSDVQQKAYRAYSLRRGCWRQILGPSVWPRLLRATWRAGVGRPVGDVRQMPGTFVIDRQGFIRFVHDPDHQAQRPSIDALVAQLSELGC